MSTEQAPKSPDRKRKSEVVTIRLDPKLKYLAELAARRQRRTLSSYIEWAIEDSLSRVHPAYDIRGEAEPTLADCASSLWDIDEPDRFAKLALNYPDLLDHEEQRIWKLIRESGLLWYGEFDRVDHEWTWNVSRTELRWDRLREHWDTFRKVARGELPQSLLPTWAKKDPVHERLGYDDEIPF
jgi:hypothetical protein